MVTKTELEHAIWYMKVLQKEDSHMQPEIRKAIDVSILIMQEEYDIWN